MLKFFKSIGFLLKFQYQITVRFFTFKSKKTGLRYFQDYGLIEAQMISLTELKRMEEDYLAEMSNLMRLQEQESSKTDPTAVRFNLGGKNSKLLS